MDRLLLRVEEAAALVGIGRTKAYELAENGTWPVVRIGRSVRIPVAALEEWAGCKITSISDGNGDDRPPLPVLPPPLRRSTPDPALGRLPTSGLRARVRDRDGLWCRYCGKRVNVLTRRVDHVVPWSAGGTTVLTNLVMACRVCNYTKGSKTLEEVGFALRPPGGPRAQEIPDVVY